MGRLIDADALMKRKQEEHGYYDITDLEFEELVKTQPTAYDVEKVVEQLGKLPKDSSWNHNSDNINRGKAIDIVREGGVE